MCGRFQTGLLVALVSSLVVSACSLNAPGDDPRFPARAYLSSARSDLFVKSVNGTPVREEDAFRAMVALAHGVALALQDDALRARVYDALHASPYPEHKVHFRSFTESGVGADLLAAAATGTGRSVESMRATRDSTLDLEFYMPVPSHFATWNGDANLLVATAYDPDEDIAVAFDLHGERVILTSADVPPMTPVLALVQRESEFAPFGGPQAAWVEGKPAGLYMTFSAIPDDYEGFLAGNPEFEVHVGWHLSGDTAMTWNSCSGEYQGGAKLYNQDDTTWTGSVQLLDSAQAVGAAAIDSVIIFTVWEDDGGACEIRTSPISLPRDIYNMTWPNPKAWRNKYNLEPEDPLEEFFTKIGMKLNNAVFGSNPDEYVGIMVDPADVSASWSDANMAIIDSLHQIAGRAKLMRLESPPAPLMPTITGPTVVGPNNYGCSQWVASLSGGVSPFQYSWTGLFSSTDSYVGGEVPETGGTLYLWMEDDEGATGSTSIVITYDPDNEDWCI